MRMKCWQNFGRHEERVYDRKDRTIVTYDQKKDLHVLFADNIFFLADLVVDLLRPTCV